MRNVNWDIYRKVWRSVHGNQKKGISLSPSEIYAIDPQGKAYELLLEYFHERLSWREAMNGHLQERFHVIHKARLIAEVATKA